MTERLRPEDIPTPMADLAAAMVAAEPTWRPCSECGEQTSGLTCFDCMVLRDRRRDAIERTEAAAPEGFRDCRFGAEGLVARVHGDRQAIARAEAAVGARQVLLRGPSGAGKTSLAVAMMRTWARQKAERAMFVLATDLANCKDRSRLGHEPEVIEAAVAAPLLVLDDVGTEAHAPGSAVVEVVFHRHAHAKPTIVTTWLADEALSQRYGDGFARRLLERVRIVECGGAR